MSRNARRIRRQKALEARGSFNANKPVRSVTPKEAALRALNESNLDFEKAIEKIAKKRAVRRKQLSRVPATAISKFRDVIEYERATIALEQQAIWELERLRKMAPDSWIRSARQLYNRDLIKSVQIDESPLETAAVLLTISAVSRKGDANSLTSGLRASRLPPSATTSLKNAIALARAGPSLIRTKIADAQKKRANKKDLEVLERLLQHAERTAKILEEIDSKPPAEKERRVTELLKKFNRWVMPNPK
ncbi:MAG: hypothetical protein J4215_04200 [Candidatus Diapherotrites archaeon]|uniref:Uncharacterized protein n=1 Tax=Candidatus Iainarchaeum sp. TaxID=3101447 RepID=A0A8T4LEN5_9ARCH|nr:hypothetical protein [Candidatus Diapherotrites archaeon]